MGGKPDREIVGDIEIVRDGEIVGVWVVCEKMRRRRVVCVK